MSAVFVSYSGELWYNDGMLQNGGEMMEFHEKLQELRKQRELTQEELAESLFVSRTAISKWESGRGYPNIESLKAISKFFSVSIDELLSGEEVLTLAERDHKEKESRFRDVIFGLLDCSIILLLFLPLFGQAAGGIIEEVSLLGITEIQGYLKAAYFAVIIGTVLWGIATLALQNCDRRFWVKNKNKISLILSAAGVSLFILSQQPYAAIYTFVFLGIKVWMLIKQR